MNFILCSNPDILEKVTSFLLLCQSNDERFALYLTDDVELPESETPLSEGLVKALRSAVIYPPALALVREELACELFNSGPLFLERVHCRLLFHLGQQRENGFVLVQGGERDDGSNLTPNDFRWVLSVTQGKARWVSDDFFISLCDLEAFADPDGLAAFFASRSPTNCVHLKS